MCKKAKNEYTKELRQTRILYYSEKLDKFKKDSKNLQKVLKELTGNQKPKVFPTNKPPVQVANDMSAFYVNKVINIRNEASSSAQYTEKNIYIRKAKQH